MLVIFLCILACQTVRDKEFTVHLESLVNQKGYLNTNLNFGTFNHEFLSFSPPPAPAGISTSQHALHQRASISVIVPRTVFSHLSERPFSRWHVPIAVLWRAAHCSLLLDWNERTCSFVMSFSEIDQVAFRVAYWQASDQRSFEYLLSQRGPTVVPHSWNVLVQAVSSHPTMWGTTLPSEIIWEV